MISPKQAPFVHLGILALAAASAAFVWTRDKDLPALSRGDVTVWGGRPAEVESLRFESKTRKVELTAKDDAVGHYFEGTVERDNVPPPHKGDAGAPPPSDLGKTTLTVVSVSAAESVAAAFAPLKALRALGKVGDDRAAEYGLDSPEATVFVKLGGGEKKLFLGSATPGGGDRYVREAASGEVFVLKGESLRSLESAESMMMERELHDFKDPQIQRAKVSAGDRSRELVRGGPEGKRFWADAKTPETNDETLGNWMSKLERLKPTEYLATAPPGLAPILRIDYSGGKAQGFLELAKAPGDKPTFLIKTERTRLYAKVPNPAAEQLEQDLGTMVK